MSDKHAQPQFNKIVEVLRKKGTLIAKEISNEMPYLLKKMTTVRIRAVIKRKNKGQIQILKKLGTKKYQLAEVG